MSTKKLLRSLLVAVALVMMLAMAACVQRADDNDEPSNEPTAGGEATGNETGNNESTPVELPPGAEEEQAPITTIVTEEAPSALQSLHNVLEQFPQYSDNGLPHVEGTTLFHGILSPAPLRGVFGGAVFSDSAEDTSVNVFLGTSSSVLSMTQFYTFGQDGIATWTHSMEDRSFTLTMQHDVYWHDGVPLTLADLAFAYYVMAHPDYASIRFSTYERMVVGIMDYHNGYADHIEGLVLSDDNRTLTIYFESMSPTKMYFGFWTSPMPRHIFENVAVADMPTHPAVIGDQIIGWGPFMFQSSVAGESVHLVRNENYVWGAPYIESVVIERIEQSLIPAAMASGRFDTVSAFPALYFGDHMNPTNFSYLAAPNGEYFYVAFRLGHWDFEEGRNVFSPEREMNNVYLRRAMALAVNEDEIGELLFNGLQFAAGSFIPPHHPGLMNLALPGFPYDPALANQILDDAGFTMGADGYRTWPDGRELSVTWASPTDAATEHILVPLYIQSWSAIGVRVVLWQGRTHDRNYLFDVLDYDADNDEIHIYNARWVAGANPHPGGRWGHAIWNPSRYTSDTWDQLLDNLSDTRAFDTAFMQQAYFDMQAHLQDVVPFFPTRWGISLVASNNRVTNRDTRVGLPPATNGWHTVRLTAAEPYGR